MTACERCWAEMNWRQYAGEYELEYQQVLDEREVAGLVCTPEEQCGYLHVLVGETCRCGKVTAGGTE